MQPRAIVLNNYRYGVALGAVVAGVALVSGCGWPATNRATLAPGGAAGGVSPCTASQLSAAIAPGQGAAGTLYSGIVLRNRSTSTCTLQGYPSVSMLDASRRPIGPSTMRSGSSGTTVVLAPGSAATSLFSVTPPACTGGAPQPASYLRVSPPGDATAITVPASMLACRPVVRSLHAGTDADGG